MTHNTLFLRFEGAMQAWGGHESKFYIRRVAEAPTKSGVIGLFCCAIGVSRQEAVSEGWLSELNELNMGVRIDRPGIRWWDFHTVGAKQKMQIAKGGPPREGAMLTRREYLCDASFLVALQGDRDLITLLFEALVEPKWTLYLGRKCCPPSRPILTEQYATGNFSDLLTALTAVPWCRRLKGEKHPPRVECLLDWIATENQPEAAPIPRVQVAPSAYSVGAACAEELGLAIAVLGRDAADVAAGTTLVGPRKVVNEQLQRKARACLAVVNSWAAGEEADLVDWTEALAFLDPHREEGP